MESQKQAEKASQSILTGSNEIDLLKLAFVFLAHWKFLLISPLVGGGVAAYLAFKVFMPVYESTALLIPMDQQSSGQLTGAAAMLLGKTTKSTGDFALYQSLLTSRTVWMNVLLSDFQDMSDTGKGRTVPLFNLLHVDTGNQAQLENVIAGLSYVVSVGPKDGSDANILQVKGQYSTPWLAQQLTNKVLSVGQNELMRIRQERYSAIQGKLSLGVGLAKSDWDSSAQKVSRFREKNRSITLPSQEMEISRMEIDRLAKEQKYLLARRELDALGFERIKTTSPMLILDSANLPTKKTKPKRRQLIQLGMLIGLSCAITFVFMKNIIIYRRANA